MNTDIPETTAGTIVLRIPKVLLSLLGLVTASAKPFFFGGGGRPYYRPYRGSHSSHSHSHEGYGYGYYGYSRPVYNYGNNRPWYGK